MQRYWQTIEKLNVGFTVHGYDQYFVTTVTPLDAVFFAVRETWIRRYEISQL
jgi:hypothetical protein